MSHAETSATLPNPLIPGFNPDPSIVEVEGTYYLATSTFEYLPGLPIYSSTDLVTWVHIGNVATRPDQIAIQDVPSGGGVWAPTIRYRDGLFYVIVSVALSPRGCVVFTATDPAGPWSDGQSIDGVDGIDPDLAWDEQGYAYVTYSALVMSGPDMGANLGIQQVRVDLVAGRALESPRPLWSGIGLAYPEAPHLYQRGEYWYLLIAEGGTERGHAISIARGTSPEGPFEGHPRNPILSAAGTGQPIQNTGHADLLRRPDGGTALVMLGVRPLGLHLSFSPLGRETYIADVSWSDGWPCVVAPQLNPGPAVSEIFDFADDRSLDDPGWISVRTTPTEVSSLTQTPGRLTIDGDGSTMSDQTPRFVGRRQRHLTAAVSTRMDPSAGTGGLAARFDEEHHFAVEAYGDGGATHVTARAVLSGLEVCWEAILPDGEVQLRMEMDLPPKGYSSDSRGGDRVRFIAATGATEKVLAEIDGRHWTSESVASFTGRVLGVYATQGTVTFRDFEYEGDDSAPAPAGPRN